MCVCVYLYVCVCIYIYIYIYIGGHALAQLAEHCATSRKVAGSLHDGAIVIFH